MSKTIDLIYFILRGEVTFNQSFDYELFLTYFTNLNDLKTDIFLLSKHSSTRLTETNVKSKKFALSLKQVRGVRAISFNITSVVNMVVKTYIFLNKFLFQNDYFKKFIKQCLQDFPLSIRRLNVNPCYDDPMLEIWCLIRYKS